MNIPIMIVAILLFALGCSMYRKNENEDNTPGPSKLVWAMVVIIQSIVLALLAFDKNIIFQPLQTLTHPTTATGVAEALVVLAALVSILNLIPFRKKA
jgi:hypothetical protein